MKKKKSNSQTRKARYHSQNKRTHMQAPARAHVLKLWERSLCPRPMSALVPVAELRPDKQGMESGRKMEPHPRSHTEVSAVMGWQGICHSFWTRRSFRYNSSQTRIPKKHHKVFHQKVWRRNVTDKVRGGLGLVFSPFCKAKFLSQSTRASRCWSALHRAGWLS